MLADIVVLDTRHRWRAAGTDEADVVVEATIFDGKVVYERR